MNQLQERILQGVSVEEFAPQTLPSLGPKCDLCGTEEIEERIYCFQCSKCYCKSCHAKHKKHAKFKNHATTFWSNVRFCSDHKDAVLEHYCSDCSVGICNLCTISHHEDHNTVDMLQMAKERRSEIKKAIAKAGNNSLNENHLLQLEKEIKTIQRAYEAEIHSLQTTLVTLDKITSRVKDEISAVQKMEEKQMDQLQSYREKCLEHMRRHQSEVTWFQEIVDKHSDQQVCDITAFKSSIELLKNGPAALKSVRIPRDSAPQLSMCLSELSGCLQSKYQKKEIGKFN